MILLLAISLSEFMKGRKKLRIGCSVDLGL